MEWQKSKATRELFAQPEVTIVRGEGAEDQAFIPTLYRRYLLLFQRSIDSYLSARLLYRSTEFEIRQFSVPFFFFFWEGGGMGDKIKGVVK